MSEIYSPGSIAGPAGPPANFAGVWAGGTAYTAGQAVSYPPNGNSYVALVNTTGNEPDSSPTAWGLLASSLVASNTVTPAQMNAAINVGIELPMSYAALASTTATVGASGIAVNGSATNTLVLPEVLPLGSYVESITLRLASAPTVAGIDVMLGTFASMSGTGGALPNENAAFTVSQRLTLEFANAVITAPGFYQWTAPSGYPMLQVTTANTYIGVISYNYAPAIQCIQRSGTNTTGPGYFETDGDIGGVGATGTMYNFQGGQLDFSVLTRAFVPLATVAELDAAIASVTPSSSGSALTVGRTSSVVISRIGSPYAAVADHVVSATGAEAFINPIIAALSESNQDGCRIYLDIGFSINGPIVLDGDNIELSGMNHCMWGGYNHAWQDTASPAGTAGANANLTATGNFPIIEMQYNHMQGTDITRHRGTCIHDLYLVGSNYSGAGISIAQMDDNVTIRDMVIQRTATGIAANLDSPTIYHNSIQDNINGINVTGVFARITENLIFDNGGYGISNGSQNAIVSGNIVGDCAGGGIVSNGTGTIIKGNQLAVNGGVAIQVNQYGDETIIASNVIDCNNTNYGFDQNGTFPNAFDRVQVNSCSGVLVEGNVFKNQTNAEAGFGVNFSSGVTVSGAFGNIFRGTFSNGGSPLNLNGNTSANNLIG